MIKKVYFCHNCHKVVKPPNMLLSANINVKGIITITCADKTCSGKIKIKPDKKVEQYAADINQG